MKTIDTSAASAVAVELGTYWSGGVAAEIRFTHNPMTVVEALTDPAMMRQLAADLLRAADAVEKAPPQVRIVHDMVSHSATVGLWLVEEKLPTGRWVGVYVGASRSEALGVARDLYPMNKPSEDQVELRA